MRVIKSGIVPSWKREVHCGVCKCHFEVVWDDVRTTLAARALYGTQDVVICPECGELCRVER